MKKRHIITSLLVLIFPVVVIALLANDVEKSDEVCENRQNVMNKKTAATNHKAVKSWKMSQDKHYSMVFNDSDNKSHFESTTVNNGMNLPMVLSLHSKDWAFWAKNVGTSKNFSDYRKGHRTTCGNL